MGDETLFSWVHLSDIHVGHGDRDKPHGWNQVLVMEALRKDVASRPGPKRVDAVLVTGDVAFSGNGLAGDEYARARDWLVAVAAAAGVSPKSIFLVPGNHDVNRGVDRDRSVARLMESLRSGPDAIDSALADAGDRAVLARRMAAYLDFAQGFAPWVLEESVPVEQRLFWMRQIDVSSLRVRLVGLNTALLAKDVDERKLQLGNEQLVAALMPPVADEGEVVVVMSHHPLSTEWLTDAKEVHGWIKSHAHVHLSGHVHEAESGELRGGSGTQFVHVVAGAVHGERSPKGVPASHGYNHGELVHDGRGGVELRVWPRRWSEANKEFRLDVDGVPNGRLFATHALRARIEAAPKGAGEAPLDRERPVAAGAPGVRAATNGPIRVFISYAPEDDELRRELEKHLALLRRTGAIESFSTRSVGAGETWRGMVDQQATDAQIFVLLLSNDYLASDYCYDVEMEAARARREADPAFVVIPVLLRELDLKKRNDLGRRETWFERLQRVPRGAGDESAWDGKPVTSWTHRDEAWTQVVVALRAAVDGLRNPRP